MKPSDKIDCEQDPASGREDARAELRAMTSKLDADLDSEDEATIRRAMEDVTIMVDFIRSREDRGHLPSCDDDRGTYLYKILRRELTTPDERSRSRRDAVIDIAIAALSGVEERRDDARLQQAHRVATNVISMAHDRQIAMEDGSATDHCDAVIASFWGVMHGKGSTLVRRYMVMCALECARSMLREDKHTLAEITGGTLFRLWEVDSKFQGLEGDFLLKQMRLLRATKNSLYEVAGALSSKVGAFEDGQDARQLSNGRTAQADRFYRAHKHFLEAGDACFEHVERWTAVEDRPVKLRLRRLVQGRKDGQGREKSCPPDEGAKLLKMRHNRRKA